MFNNNIKDINHQVKTQEVSAEVVGLLFADTNKALSIGLITALIILWSLSSLIQLKPAILWMTLISASYLLKYIIYINYKLDIAASRHAYDWLKKFRLSTAISGLAWGSSGLLIFPANNSELQSLFAFVLGGVCAGGLITYSIDKLTVIPFVSSIILLASPAFLMDSNPHANYILFMAFVFIMYVAVASSRLARGLIDNIALRVYAENQKKEISKLSLRQQLHLEHTPMGVIEWDADLKVISWNKACFSTFGFTSEEALGQHISYFLPDLKNKINPVIVDYLLNQNDIQLSKISTKNGDIIHCEWFNTILKNEYEQIVGFASLVQDKTAFVSAQDKIRYLAYYDALTNLPNRGLLLDRLHQVIAAHDRTHTFSVVAFIDLDHF